MFLFNRRGRRGTQGKPRTGNWQPTTVLQPPNTRTTQRGLRPQPKSPRAETRRRRARKGEDGKVRTKEGRNACSPPAFFLSCLRPVSSLRPCVSARDIIPWVSISYVRCFPESSCENKISTSSNAKNRRMGLSPCGLGRRKGRDSRKERKGAQKRTRGRQCGPPGRSLLASLFWLRARCFFPFAFCGGPQIMLSHEEVTAPSAETQVGRAPARQGDHSGRVSHRPDDYPVTWSPAAIRLS